jgi:predicted nucleic acid-binding protein
VPRSRPERLDALVLDANVLVKDWLLESPAATHIRSQSAYGPLGLLVPELAIREVVRVYRRQLKTAQRELHSAPKKRRQLQAGAPDPVLERVSTSVDVDAAAAEYDSRLRQVLDRARARVLPLRSVSHERLVEEVLQGRKPFDQEGRKGYRDALIWHSVLEVAGTFRRVILVSANHTDFAESSKDPERLAHELVEDVAALHRGGEPAINVSLRKDLASVIEHEFPAQHTVVMELRERLQKDRAFFATVYNQLNDVQNQLLAELDLDPELDVEWEDLDLDFINDLHDFEVVGVAPGRAGSPSFVRIIGHADAQYQVEVSAWSAFDERGLPVRDDIDWNDRTDKGRLTDVLPAELDFQALYIPGEDKLAEVELITIREEWDWVDENRVIGGPVERPESLS